MVQAERPARRKCFLRWVSPGIAAKLLRRQKGTIGPPSGVWDRWSTCYRETRIFRRRGFASLRGAVHGSVASVPASCFHAPRISLCSQTRAVAQSRFTEAGDPPRSPRATLHPSPVTRSIYKASIVIVPTGTANVSGDIIFKKKLISTFFLVCAGSPEASPTSAK